MAVAVVARRLVAPSQAVAAGAWTASQSVVMHAAAMRACAISAACQPPSLAARGISTASATGCLPGLLRAAASAGALPLRNAGHRPVGVPGIAARAAAAADSKRTLFGYKFQRREHFETIGHGPVFVEPAGGDMRQPLALLLQANAFRHSSKHDAKSMLTTHNLPFIDRGSLRMPFSQCNWMQSAALLPIWAHQGPGRRVQLA